MARMSWRNPPPLVAIGGTETFLVRREIRTAVRVTEQSGRRVIYVGSDLEVIDALSTGHAFGDACLIVVSVKNISIATVLEVQKSCPKKTGILITVAGKLDEKKYPVLQEIHQGFKVQHTQPSSRKDREKLAARFIRVEASRLMGAKKALSSDLSEALVNAIGTDLGTLAMELVKVTALARFEGKTEITVAHARALIRPSTAVELGPLREALKRKDGAKTAAAMVKIRRRTGGTPFMLLLRAKGGPADLTLKWLRAAILLEGGASAEEIAARTGTPLWAVEQDVIPAARRWGVSALRNLIHSLSRADRGVSLGDPAPWVSCETALLLGCAE